MKSVGEVMAIGRTFKEALGKGIRSLETGRSSARKLRSVRPDSQEADHARRRTA
jgi:carbamoyl-phosphate synthase large subunit